MTKAKTLKVKCLTMFLQNEWRLYSMCKHYLQTVFVCDLKTIFTSGLWRTSSYLWNRLCYYPINPPGNPYSCGCMCKHISNAGRHWNIFSCVLLPHTCEAGWVWRRKGLLQKWRQRSKLENIHKKAALWEGKNNLIYVEFNAHMHHSIG